MPVEKSIGTPPRQIVFLVISIVLGLGSMVFVFTRISDQTDLAQLQAELGPSVFIVGPVDDIAEGIRENGPFLFSDTAGNDRDIYLQHLGDDPLTGWLAFAARMPSSARDCFAQWKPDRQEFVDTCDNTVYSATGDNLPPYAVSVDQDGILSIDLG